MTDIQERISQNRRQTNEQIERIRQDSHLSEQGKKAAIERIYEQSQQKHQALKEQHEVAQEQQRASMHEDLFGPRFTISMPDYKRDQLRSQYRRALQEADEILTGEEGEYNVRGLLRFMEVSELAQDETALRAAFAVASNRGVQPAIEWYLSRHPEKAEQYRDYSQLDQAMRQPTARQKLEQIFGLSGAVRPSEVRDRRDNPMADIFGGR